MGNFWQALIQVWDFLEKAIEAYIQTPQGMIEFNQIFEAWNTPQSPEVRSSVPQKVYVPKNKQ